MQINEVLHVNTPGIVTLVRLVHDTGYHAWELPTAQIRDISRSLMIVILTNCDDLSLIMMLYGRCHDCCTRACLDKDISRSFVLAIIDMTAHLTRHFAQLRSF